jgi:HEAT repeat protein
VPGLVKLLGDDMADARTAAALALHAIGDRKGVAGLAAQLKREKDAGPAMEMVNALGALGGPEAKAALTDAAATHPVPTVRNNAGYQAEQIH